MRNKPKRFRVGWLVVGPWQEETIDANGLGEGRGRLLESIAVTLTWTQSEHDLRKCLLSCNNIYWRETGKLW